MEHKSIALILIGFVVGFACAFPVGYTAGHKTSAGIYQKKLEQIQDKNGATIKAAVSAEPAGSGKTVMEEYIRKNTYFSVPAAKGGNLSLSNYKGKPVLLMFYTETCPYCRKAAPTLEKMYRQYSGKGLAVLGLCAENEADAPKHFSADLGLTFPMGYKAQEVVRKYGAQGVPFIFMLNKKHEVTEVWPGFSPEYEQEMKKAVERALAE